MRKRTDKVFQAEAVRLALSKDILSFLEKRAFQHLIGELDFKQSTTLYI